MALLLLKSGKQILRLSSSLSSAASQQRLGGVTAAANFTRRSLCTVPDNPNYGQHKQDDDFEKPPPKTLKSFFSNLFFRGSPPPPPTGPSLPDMLRKFMDLAEKSKNCSEDRLSRILDDDIRPVLTEVLHMMSDKTIVRLVNEFARPAASSPPVVIDRSIKAMVDKLPSHVIHLCIDLMLDMFWKRYGFRSSYNLSFPSNSRSVVYTADVSHIGKEHLKLFMVGDNLMVTGLEKYVPPGCYSDELLACYQTVHNALLMPSWPYSRDEVTASIIKDQELKIVVPIHDKTEVVANKPRVFQLNIAYY